MLLTSEIFLIYSEDFSDKIGFLYVDNITGTTWYCAPHKEWTSSTYLIH